MSSSSNEALGINKRFWRKTKLGSQDYTTREHQLTGQTSADDATGDGSVAPGTSTEYRTYKRRWFGFVQLTLMNIMVSWDWLTFAPVADQAATYYSTSTTAINWISTAFLFSFVVVSPIVIIVIHKGPKLALMTSAVLILIGNWVRYAGSTHRHGGNFAAALVGEIIIGFAQPFVLAAPTRYSDLWFTSKGRVAATALTSLANPLGAALGQLINPFWVQNPGDISQLLLYISIISSVICLPAFFVPANPPTPVGPSSQTPKLHLRESLGVISGSLELWLILIPFSVYVGFFNSISSLLNQIMLPYGFSDDQAGIGGAVLIVVGLVFAAITSPILDRTRRFLFAVKLFVPIIAFSYLAFTWMPQTRTIVGPYIVLAILGAASFALVPIALEHLIELSHPLSPEITSTIGWTGGQLLGGIFIIVSNALTAGKNGSPPKNMRHALIFQTVVALVVLPLPMCLGLFGRQDKVVLRRIRSDEQEQTENAVQLEGREEDARQEA